MTIAMPQSTQMMDASGKLRPEWAAYLTAVTRELNAQAARIAKLEAK